jgi:hypothetical protein
MRSRIIHAIGLVIVMICLWAHVSELFDTWDRTLQTGSDTESTVATVALCIGGPLVLLSVLLRLFRKLVSRTCPFPLLLLHVLSCTFDVAPIPLSLSPPPLRV